VIGFFLFRKMGEGTLFLLPFIAGNFIYIAASDLIPQIKDEKDFLKSAARFLVFLAGIFLMFLLKFYG